MSARVRTPFDANNVTACNHPTLRADILKSLRRTKQTHLLGDCDLATAKELGVPTEWVYTVRCHLPLPEEPIPAAYDEYRLNRPRPGRPTARQQRTRPHLEVTNALVQHMSPTVPIQRVDGPLSTYNKVITLLATRPLSCVAILAGVPPLTVAAVCANTYVIR